MPVCFKTTLVDPACSSSNVMQHLDTSAVFQAVCSFFAQQWAVRCSAGLKIEQHLSNACSDRQRCSDRSPAVAVCERGTKNPYTAEDDAIDTSGTWWADT